MAKFIAPTKPVVRFPNEKEFINDFVNLSKCKRIALRDESLFHDDATLYPLIIFVGCDMKWFFLTDEERMEAMGVVMGCCSLSDKDLRNKPKRHNDILDREYISNEPKEKDTCTLTEKMFRNEPECGQDMLDASDFSELLAEFKRCTWGDRVVDQQIGRIKAYIRQYFSPFK